MVFNGEGCATIYYTESVEEKNNEEGKEIENGEKSVADWI